MAFEELQIDKVLFWRKINKKPHKTKQQQQQQKAKRQGYSIDWLSFLISINKKKKKKNPHNGFWCSVFWCSMYEFFGCIWLFCGVGA